MGSAGYEFQCTEVISLEIELKSETGRLPVQSLSECSTQ
jgi:hypothetical protein